MSIESQLPEQQFSPLQRPVVSHQGYVDGVLLEYSPSAPISKAPPVEVKLFVGRVPRTFVEDTLRPYFEEFGTVGDVIIIRDQETGAHKGCAFVRMASITKADSAIRALNNSKVLDASLGPLQVKYAAKELERLGLPPDTALPGFDQAKLFVGSLSKDATEEEIKEVFSRFGTLDEIYLMKDEQKKSKGCAFVKFAYKEEAFHAVANLNGKYTMPGSQRAMEVRFAVTKIKTAHQPVYARQDSGGFGNGSISEGPWQEYFNYDGRPYYHNTITKVTQWEKPPELDSPRALPTHGPPGANVFIFHIPNEWNEVDMITHFNPFGQIVSARIATDKHTGRNRGFGFVSYSSVQSSIAAVAALNGYSVSGKRLKVQIKKGEESYAEGMSSYMGMSIQHRLVGNGASLQPSVHLAAMQAQVGAQSHQHQFFSQESQRA